MIAPIRASADALFAAGEVKVSEGVVLAPLLLLLAFVFAGLVGNDFMEWLLIYFGLTTAYTWGLKRLILLDCVALAVLYTLRIIAGAAAAGLPLSFWLLAFAVFVSVACICQALRQVAALTHHAMFRRLDEPTG